MATKFHTIKFQENSSTERIMKIQFALFHILSSFWLVAPIWVIFMMSKGYNLQEISLADIAFYGSILLFEIPTGVIADKFGRKTSVFYAYMLQGTGMLYFAFSQSMASIILSFVVWGIGVTMVSGAIQAWIYDEFLIRYGEEGVEKEFQSFYGKLSALGLLFTTIAYIISGFLAEISLNLPIIINAVLFYLSGFVVLTIGENYKSSNDKSEAKKEMLEVIKRPKLIALIFVSVISSGIIVTLIFWMQPFLASKRFEFSEIGTILAIGILSAAFGNYLSKRISERLDNRLLPIMFILLSLSVFLMSISNAIIVVSLFIGLRFIRGVFNPFFTTILNRDFSPQFRATAISVISALSTISIMSLEYLTATIIQNQSYQAFFVFSGMLLSVIVLPLAVWYGLKN